MITAEDLYGLLPAIHRIRDAERGEVLKALLSVLAEQANVIDADIERLYDNWFIETCDEWVVPYIGDLLGVRGLHPITGATFSQRARVANTLGYRRRKGTATMLEQLARDVTGWPARAVEYFELLQTTQHVNHVRAHNTRTPDLRGTLALELIGSPFERAARSPEVRRIARERGRYNIPNVGLWLWRLQSYPVTRGTARELQGGAAGRYTFSPLGISAPLFNEPRTESEITSLAQEHNVPGMLRRLVLYQELESRRRDLALGRTPQAVYFGEDPVLEVFLDGEGAPVTPENILICNLEENALGDWRRPPLTKTYPGPAGPKVFDIRVAVDPELGRLTFAPGLEPRQVEVSYSYGFSGDFGGGPYDRNTSVAAAIRQRVTFQRGVTQTAPAGDPNLRPTIAAALADWNLEPAGACGLIVIMDSRTYPGDLAIEIKPGSELILIAADWPRIGVLGSFAADDLRPHVLGGVTVSRGPGAGDAGSLIVDGLLVEGGVALADGCLSALRIANSTLAPDAAGLQGTNVAASVELDHTVCGAIVLGLPAHTLRLIDSSAGKVSAPGAAATLERSTVLGSVEVRSLEAGNGIFVEPVSVERRQTGCIRFCYLPDVPATPRPRRYRCQPDLALKDVDDPAEQARIRARIRPVFHSLSYGQPAFLQLARACAAEIAAGAEDGSEMGVFSSLKQPLRTANLRASLDEYLRFGLEAGIFFVT
ncbi:MAG TPA: hypothetical protein DEH78_08020 [Solibacterales bacterium]|nr:hypothetical protein [Bryobacterales bacterium]